LSAINVRERRIRVGPQISKIRRMRIIEDVPTILWAQLALWEQRDGSVFPPVSPRDEDGLRERATAWRWSHVRAEAGRRALVPLAHDVLRHSFATYFVALTGSPDRCAKILGHYDLRMLAEHYDGVATKQDAEDYFHPKPILALPAPSPAS
jgi:integrase